MTIKAPGRSALILATGLFVCFAGPSQAAAAEDATASAKSGSAGAPIALHKYAGHSPRHWKKYAHRGSSKVALKSAAGSKADAADDGDRSTAIPPSVANAHAQLAAADTPTGNAAKAMSARSSDIVQAAPDKPADGPPAAPDAPVVSSDQLNDVDRALRESTPPATTPPAVTRTAASPQAPAAPVASVAASNESSSLDKTSLIGKIFIGFGALLTMASAARMFIA